MTGAILAPEPETGIFLSSPDGAPVILLAQPGTALLSLVKCWRIFSSGSSFSAPSGLSLVVYYTGGGAAEGKELSREHLGRSEH